MGKSKKRPFFPMFFRYEELVEQMTDDQAGILLKKLFKYASSEELPDISDAMVKAVFSVMKVDVDESLRKYEETCEKNRERVQKRWAKAAESSDNSLSNESTTVYHGIPAYTENTNRREAEAEGKQKRSRREVEAEQTEEKSSAVAVSEKFVSLFGHSPSKALLNTIDGCGLSEDDVIRAIEYSESKKPRNPEGYITQVLRVWKAEGVPRTVTATSEPTDNDWLTQYNNMISNMGY